MPWQCPHCGKWSRWRYRSCNICGAARPLTAFRRPFHHRHHRSNKSGIIILFGIIIVLLLGYIVYNLGGSNIQSVNTHGLTAGFSSTTPQNNSGSSETLQEWLNTPLGSPLITSGWVENFMRNLSSYRSAPLTECKTLDNFSKVRFNTMTSNNNWDITHYGFANDSISFMNGRYEYYTGEDVLLPSGYTPSGYIPYLMQDAPLHFDSLTDNNFSYYGYYIGSAPVISVYQPCSVTELPGPNINVTQYYEQHNCQTTVSSTTWLVIDLSEQC